VFVRAARSGLALGAIAGAVAYTVATELLPVGPSFFRENLIEPHERTQVMVSVAIAILVTVGAAFTAWTRNRRDAWVGLDWLARVTSPLLVLPLATPLLRPDFSEPAAAALQLALVVLLFERLMRVSLEAWGLRPGAAPKPPSSPTASFWPVLIVVAAVLAQTIYMSVFATWSHQRFATFGYDLGQYDSIFANTLGGRPLRMPTLGWDYDWGELNGHADFAVFLFLPLYALRPSATTLLVLQAALVNSAAIALFFIGRRRLPAPAAAVVALCWLGYPPLHACQLFDVHMQPFGMAFMLWAVAALDARRYAAYWVLVIVALACREDVSIGLAVLGAILFVTGASPRTGAVTSIVATTYFVLVRFFVMKNPGWSFADNFRQLYPLGESGYGSIMKTLASNPGYTLKTVLTWEKLRYVAQLLAPLAFVPLRRVPTAALLVPGAILTILTTGYAPTISISFQYVANWAGYAFLGGIFVLAATWKANAAGGRALLAAIVVGVVLANQQWGAWTINPSVKAGFADVPLAPPTTEDLQREKNLMELTAGLDVTAAICASDRVQPHLTSRHLSMWTLKDGLYACRYLVWSALPADLGAERGASAVQATTYRIVRVLGDLTLAERLP
jgi:uncharacterized membrane protein